MTMHDDDEPVEVAGLGEVLVDLVHAGVEIEYVANHLVDRAHDDPDHVAAQLGQWHELIVCARDIKDTIDTIYRACGAVLAAHYHSEGRKPREEWEASGRTFTLTAGSARKSVDHEALAAALVDFCDENGLGPVMAAATVLSVVPLTRSTAVRTAAMKELGLNPDLYVEWFDRGPDRVTVSAAPFLDVREVGE
jgi:hypothetical protein